MFKSKNQYLVPLLLSGFLAVGLWIGHSFSPTESAFSGTSGQEKYQKMQDIINVLNEKYVDTLNGDALFEQTISDMLHKLDPHSNYISAKDLQSVNESIQGQFGGVGVRFMILRDTICVTNVISGSPSQRAGVQSGDKIIQVDGIKVAGKKISNEKVMSLLKGGENTTVSVRLLRNKKIINKRIVRGMIPIESVVSVYMVNKKVGYIKIDEFSVTTSDEFRKASSWLVEQGMKSLVLDLRNNGGGVLQSAIEIADEFLGKGIPIVKTKGEHTGSYTYRATSKGNLEKTKVAILINSNSASASEIVAGAIQDNDRGSIIGRRSFGKGLVQEDVRLRDGSDLRLTIARYYTPTGRCIQKSYDKGYEEYMADQIDRYDNGELYRPDSSLFVDSLKYKTPKGKIVYGGGGIMPDVFVPFDSSGTSLYYTDLRFSQSFNGFAFDYVSDKRTKWKTAEEFERTFNVTDDLIQRFAVFAQKEMKIQIVKSELNHSKKLIAKTLKAEIARQLWLENAYYKIVNQEDNEFQKAISTLLK